MIDDSDRLKPCPFCGGAAEMGCVRSESGEEPNEGGYFIACLACDASTGLRFACGDDPKPLLIEQWNRRAALAQQAEPTQTPCDIAEDGVCEVIDCCRNPKQAEPVAWVLPDLLPVFSFKTAQLWKRPFAEDQIPLYTAPPQRKPLTEEEIYEMYSEPSSDAEMVEFARAIERAHGIGGDDEQV